MNISTSWYSIKATKDDAPAEVSIYEEIGLWGVTAKEFIFDLNRAKGRDLNLTIHTPGGEVIDGLAIYNALRKHDGKVNVTIDAYAASMGSVIALAGDSVRIVDNGFVFVHNPLTLAVGNAAEMEKISEDLRKFEQNLVNIYVERTGLKEDSVRELMDAETWLTAEEAVEKGFADEIIKATKAAASLRKEFQGSIARTLEKNRPLPMASNGPKQKPKTERIKMPENAGPNPEELQAKIDELTAVIDSKDEEINGLLDAVSKKDEAIEDNRTIAAEIVSIGKAHNKLDSAIAAIEEGKSVEDFRAELLESYALANKPSNPDPEDGERVNPDKEPATRAEFIKTYNSLSGPQANKYWTAYQEILKEA